MSQLDLLFERSNAENYCSSHTTVNSVSGGGLANGETRQCIWGDSLVFEFPFIPYVVDDPAGCDDASDFITYVIEYDAAFSSSKCYITVDLENSVIRIETGPDLTTAQAEGIYYFTIMGVLPDRTMFSWPLEIGWTHCADEVFSAPVLVDQTYIITTPYADYDPPEWLMTPDTCIVPYIYTNQVTPVNTWITGVSDNLGDGKIVGWFSTEETHKGEYNVSILAKSQCSKVEASYTLEVLSQCWVDPYDIDFSDTVFGFPALIQNVWQPASTLTWDSTKVEITVAGIDCGLATFTITNADDTPIDAEIFTENLSLSGGSNTLTVQTNDSNKVGSYLLKVTATLIDYPTNVRSRDFEILIEDICEAPNSVTPTSLVNQVYIIARPAQLSVPAYDPFVYDPSYCPFSYGFYLSPALPAADINAITLDPLMRQFTYETTNLAL